MAYSILKILGVLNHGVRSCGDHLVFCSAYYSIVIVIDLGIQESDADFEICEFKFYSGTLLLRLPMNSISSDSVFFNKKKSIVNLHKNVEMFLR